jgi:hypothetical protein
MFSKMAHLENLHVGSRPTPAGELEIPLSERLTKLLQVLASSRTLSVTDRRDRVFGLLGLCSKAFGVSLVEPDYTAEPGAIFTEFAYAFLRASGSLLLLHHVSYPYNSITSLPSWVPDWTSSYAFETEIARMDRSRFKASGGLLLDISRESSRIRLSCICVDRIKKVGMACDESCNELRPHYRV